MIKDFTQEFSVLDICPSSNSYYHKDRYTLPQFIGEIIINSSRYGGKKMLDEILSNVDESLHQDVIDLYLFACFNSAQVSFLLDGKNKYATYFYSKAKSSPSNGNYYNSSEPEGSILETMRRQLSKYDLYKVSANYIGSKDRKAFRETTDDVKHYRSKYVESMVSNFLSCKTFEKKLKEIYTLSDFRFCLAGKTETLEQLSLHIELLNIFGRDEKVISNFLNVKPTSLGIVGSAVRFNYLWKCLNYSPEEVFLDALLETVDDMKVSGSPEYVKNYDKLKKWSEKNPEFKDKFKELKSVENPENFMADSSESISFNLYVDALQKLSKKKKSMVYKSGGYATMLENLFNDLKYSIPYFHNYVGTVSRELNTGEKIITITFNYETTENSLNSVSKNDLKSLYESVIIDAVDSNYELDEKIIKIRVEALVMNLLIPSKANDDKKAFKV